MSIATMQDNQDMITQDKMDRNLALEAVRVTEAAALAASVAVGCGDEKYADKLAVDAMRSALNSLAIKGRVVIGEGERDEAPMLYIGEEVGAGGPEVDIALDPLEGTTITAKGGANAITVMAMADKDGFLNAPDTYMEKIAVGRDIPASVLDLDAPMGDVLAKIAKETDRRIKDIMVCVMDRPRHDKIISEIREAGARISLIQDGDVSAIVAASEAQDTGIDMFVGTGGAPEGVLSAAALQCVDGHMLGRLVFRNDAEKERAQKWGITDFDKIYTTDELAKPDNVMFAATGVTNGPMMPGVKRFKGGAKTYSIVMRSKSGTTRHIESTHNFNRKTGFMPQDK